MNYAITLVVSFSWYTYRHFLNFVAQKNSLMFYPSGVKLWFKGILCDFSSSHLNRLFALNKYCAYITNLFPKYHMSEHGKMRYQKTIWKESKKINCCMQQFIFQMSIVKQFRAWIALKLGSLLSFMIRNAFLYKWASVRKIPDRGRASLTIS